MAIQKLDRHQLVLDYWNEKKIVVHRRLSQDIIVALNRIFRDYPVEEVKEFIDFYATILEPNVPEAEKKYFWSYKWNLYEFLTRGIKKFDGQHPSNYLKKQTIVNAESLVLKRNSNKK